MNTSRLRAFHDELLRQLVANHNPVTYKWPVTDAPKIAARYMAEIDSRGYSKDGLAFKATLKALGITPTYTGIEAWLNAPAVSWKPELLIGEVWVPSDFRFATKAEAEAYAKDAAPKFCTSEVLAAESDDPPRHAWDFKIGVMYAVPVPA